MDTTQTPQPPRPSVDALVFDAYGTLFDVQALTPQCEADWPGQGAAVSALWRGTQLEYSWLRSLMGRYADFERITADARRAYPVLDGIPVLLVDQALLLPPGTEAA